MLLLDHRIDMVGNDGRGSKKAGKSPVLKASFKQKSLDFLLSTMESYYKSGLKRRVTELYIPEK